MTKPIISVENLGKKYRISHQKNGRGSYTALRDVIADGIKNFGKKCNNPSEEDFWALKDVSFTVEPGDRIGIIGRNGAGKSTLLKILSRITEPTTGKVIMRGRVASLLEVGTGFHPELTGRENIFLNGAILGMKRAEIKRKFDEIVDFAEVEKFLDTPVKRYSSGMYVRLAFAVAAHLEPEILLVDEVLAVGDTVFQKKCLGKMEDVSKKDGRTILFVSHNLAMINTMCDKSMLISHGELIKLNKSSLVIEEYLNSYSNENLPINTRKDRVGSQKGKFTSLKIKKGSNLTSTVNTGDTFLVEMEIELWEKLKVPHIGVLIGDNLINTIVRAHTWESCKDIKELQVGKHKILCEFSNIPLLKGNYSIDLRLGEKGELWDFIRNAAELHVESSDVFNTGNCPKDATCYTKNKWVFL